MWRIQAFAAKAAPTEKSQDKRPDNVQKLTDKFSRDIEYATSLCQSTTAVVRPGSATHSSNGGAFNRFRLIFHASEPRIMHAVKRTIPLLLGASVLMLSACNSGGQSPAAQPDSAASALPPRYLEVDQFQSCLASKQVGTYQQWCMPASKPDGCPSQSWDQLDKMQGNDKVPSC